MRLALLILDVLVSIDIGSGLTGGSRLQIAAGQRSRGGVGLRS